jgi:SSS family solute:Na+ symporter
VLQGLTLGGLTAGWGSRSFAAGPSAGATAGDQAIEVGGLDMTIILVYLIGIVALGCWAGMRRKGAKGSDYFLAGKSLSWPVIGLALFATNISTIHLVSFAQNGYTSGLTYGNFEWMAAFTLVILSLFFAPFYLRSKVATLPDFMEKRFSRGSRDYLAVLSIFSAIVVHIGFSLHTGAIVLEGTLLQNFVDNPEQYHWATILAMCGVTAIYTIVGGLLAVVLTESIQTLVLLVGSFCITVIGFQMIGGWGELKASVHPVNLSMLRAGNDPTGITWYAVFLGYPVLGVWYWCTDQTIVQRVLGAKDENHARVGPLFAGFIKILPVFLFVLPGVVCLGLVNRGLIPDLPARADGAPMTERTYTHMIQTMLWPGMQGLVIAAMLAALMSTVSGALNSIATLCSYDIYKRFKPAADDRHLVRVGRIATFVAMCVAVLWSMGIGQLGETIFQAMVDVFPVVAPPTAVVFLWGVFYRRTSSRASLWTLIGGSVVGIVIYALKMLDDFHVIELDDVNAHLASFMAMNSLFKAFVRYSKIPHLCSRTAKTCCPHRCSAINSLNDQI